MTDESFVHFLLRSKWMLANTVLMVLSLSLLIYFIYSKDRLAQTCLRAGYPDSKLVGWQDGSCIRRLNNTDIVTPVSHLP